MIQAAPTPEEEFAAGLEAVTNPVVESPAVAAPMSVMDWARSQFEIPETETEEQFADRIEAMQKAASELEKLRVQNAEYQALIAAQHLAQQNQPAPAAVAPVATETPAQAAQRRYDAIKLDDQLAPYLTEKFAEVDPTTGMYKPIMLIPQVMDACNLKNKAMQRQRQIGEALTSDFYGTMEDGVVNSPSYQAMKKQFDELKSQMESQFAPLQKSREELENERFLFLNQNILYQSAADGSLVPSAAGELYQSLVEAGMAQDKAIEIAKSQQAKFAAPAPTVAPAAAAPVVEKKPLQRFAEPIARRMANSAPANRRAADPVEVMSPNFKPSWDEVCRAAQAAAAQN